MHQSCLLIHVLIRNSFMFRSQSATLLVVRSTLILPAHSIKGTTGCGRECSGKTLLQASSTWRWTFYKGQWL